jgi:uracil-DNA glycosylase family 4
MEDAAAKLEEIAADVQACLRCETLAAQRLCAVPGAGHPHAEIMIVAPFPSPSDEERALPAGSSLLEELKVILPGLAEAPRASIYVTALLKCVPRDGGQLREALDSERDACYGFLSKEISVTTPHFLLPVGRETSAFVLHRLFGRAPSNALPPAIRVMASPALKVVPLAAPVELDELSARDKKAYIEQLRAIATRIGL